MSNRLQNKRALIIGGTSGIGLATAKKFMLEGARIVIVGLNPAEADNVGFEVAGLGNWFAMSGDASDAAIVDRLIAHTIQHLGGLDILFHVAGISGRRHGDGPLHECSHSGWDATLDANLKSVFLTNRAAIRQFLAQATGGVILNMASVLALSPAPTFFDTAAYTASKGGVIALSQYAAARYAKDRIRVNVLAPGLIDTPMATRAVNDPAIRTYLDAKQPLGPGPGTPDDCANAALYLCSDEARFVSGVILPVDGGWCVS